MASACLKEMRLNGEVVQSNVVYEPTLVIASLEPFGPLSRGEDDGCTLTDLKLQIIDDEVAEPSVEGLRVLVFSKTQTFRHDSIAEGHACKGRLAQRHAFQMTSTEDAAMFNRDALEDFDVVVFMNTTGDVLNDQQQSAFQSWYQSGGAFLGVHAASDTEHGWDWFGQLVGRFRCHPAVQPARLIVMDRGHPATAHLDSTWVRTDEWYDFKSDGPHEGCNCLLRIDENTYTGGQTGPWHPMAWSHEFDGGRSFYTRSGTPKRRSRSRPSSNICWVDWPGWPIKRRIHSLRWSILPSFAEKALGVQFCFCVWAAEEIYPCQLRPTLPVCSMPAVWP